MSRESPVERVSAGRGTAASQVRPLPEDFEPSDDDVICGRGKKCYNHIGNARFRVRVHGMLEEYKRAKSKLDKSNVLSEVVEQVRQNSPLGGFVKQDSSGRWYEVGDFLAREKTSQAFRDALHDRYKSSNVSKKKRRKREQATKAASSFMADFDMASRLEKLSSEVIGAHAETRGLDPFDLPPTHPGAREEHPSSRGYLPPRRESSSSHRHSFQQSFAHLHDPLFGLASNVSNVGPSEGAIERIAPESPYYRRRSHSAPVFPESEFLQATEPMHNSMPEIIESGTSFRDFDFDASMHQSAPNLDYGKPVVATNEALDTKPSARGDIPPRIPYERLKKPPPETLKLPPPSGQVAAVRKSASMPQEIPSASVSSVKLSRDLLDCLEKFTQHSITGDPFEPIPLPPGVSPRRGSVDSDRYAQMPPDESDHEEFGEG